MFRVCYGKISEHKLIKKTDKNIRYHDEFLNINAQEKIISSRYKWFESAKDAFIYLWDEKKRALEIASVRMEKVRNDLADFENEYAEIIGKLDTEKDDDFCV